MSSQNCQVISSSGDYLELRTSEGAIMLVIELYSSRLGVSPSLLCRTCVVLALWLSRSDMA